MGYLLRAGGPFRYLHRLKAGLEDVTDVRRPLGQEGVNAGLCEEQQLARNLSLDLPCASFPAPRTPRVSASAQP